MEKQIKNLNVNNGDDQTESICKDKNVNYNVNKTKKTWNVKL